MSCSKFVLFPIYPTPNPSLIPQPRYAFKSFCHFILSIPRHLFVPQVQHPFWTFFPLLLILTHLSSLHANHLAPAFPIPIPLMNSDSCPICNQIETSPLTRIKLSHAMCVLLRSLYLRRWTEEDWTLGMNNLVVAIILHSSSSPFIALPNYHFNKITPMPTRILIANPVPLIPSKFQKCIILTIGRRLP